MPKGRPPLEPRIAALENRLAELERQVSHLTMAPAINTDVPSYKPNFDHWPNASGR